MWRPWVLTNHPLLECRRHGTLAPLPGHNRQCERYASAHALLCCCPAATLRDTLTRQAKVRTHDLQNKSKTDLLNQVEELRKELLQLRVQKVAGGASSKLARMYVLYHSGLT